MNEKVIVMNSFHRAEWKHDMNIVAHCFAEHFSSKSWSASGILDCIDGTNSHSYWLDISSFNKIEGIKYGKNIQYVLPVYEPQLYHKYGFNLSYPTMAYQTTAQLAIQVAMHMGFKDIYLIGFDHDWLSSRDYSRHFYSLEKDSTDGLENLSYLKIIEFMKRMWTIYYAMERIAKKLDVKIINLSSRTFLDVFKSGSIDSYIKNTS